MEENPIYKFMRDNSLTQLDEKSFLDKYSDPNEATKIHKFMIDNELTKLDSAGFYDKYLKKKDDTLSPSSVGELPSDQTPKQPTQSVMYGPMGAMGIQRTEDYKPSTENTFLQNAMNFFGQTAAGLPGDILEFAAMGSAFTERQLAKAGVPFADPNIQAEDINVLGIEALNPVRASKEWKAALSDLAPVDEDFKDTFAGGIFSGMGQMVSMMMTGGGSAAPQIAKLSVLNGSPISSIISAGKELARNSFSKAGLIGGAQNATASYNQAKQEGATEDQALRFGIENFLVGNVFENMPIQAMLARIAKIDPNASILKKLVKEKAQDFTEEFFTEEFQSLYSDMSAQRIYDENRKILDSFGYDGAVGGTTAVIMSSILSALIGRRGRVMTQQEGELIDKAIQETQDKINTVEENNKNVQETVSTLEKTKFRTINDGSQDLQFIEMPDGSVEYTEEGMSQPTALAMAGVLNMRYPNFEFSLKDNTGKDPLSPSDFTITGRPKRVPSYSLSGQPLSKEDFDLKLSSAKSIADLEGISIQNDPEREAVLSDKFKELENKPKEKPTPLVLDVNEKGQFNINGEQFPDARIITENGEKKAVFVRGDKTVSVIKDANVIEDLEYRLSLKDLEGKPDNEIDQIWANYQTKKSEERMSAAPKIKDFAGEFVTVKTPRGNVTARVQVDEGGKITVEDNQGTIYDLDENTPFVEFQSPVTITRDKKFDVLGEVYDEAVIEGDKAVLMKSDGTVKEITNPTLVEEIDYRINLLQAQNLTDAEADEIWANYQLQKSNDRIDGKDVERKDTGTTEERVAETDEDIKLREALEEIDLIEQLALMELEDVESQAKLVEFTPKTMKTPSVYLVKKNADGSYTATINGRKVARPEIVSELGKLFEQQTGAEVSKLQEQTNKLKQEVEQRLFGRGQQPAPEAQQPTGTEPTGTQPTAPEAAQQQPVDQGPDTQVQVEQPTTEPTLPQILEDEKYYFENNGEWYEYSDLYNEDPRKAALKRAEDLVEMGEKNPESVPDIEAQRKAVEILKADLEANPPKAPIKAKPTTPKRVARPKLAGDITTAVENSAKSVGMAFPKVQVIIGENVRDINKQIRDLFKKINRSNFGEKVVRDFRTARGMVVTVAGDPVTLILDKNKIRATTPAHEVWHLLLGQAFGRNPAKFKQFQQAISKQLTDAGYSDIDKYLTSFMNLYKGDQKYEEYLSELGGLLATKGIDVSKLDSPAYKASERLTDRDKSLLMRIKDVINKFSKELLGKEVFLKDATPENILQFMTAISDKVARGEDVSGMIGVSKGNVKRSASKGLETKMQADFSDRVSKLTFVYDKNSDRFDKLKKDGFINENVDINDFNGATMLLHQPDAAFSGEIQKNGETIVEGKGGVYYPIKFHGQKLFWASTKGGVTGMIKTLNDISKKNGGKVYMALTSAPYDKLLSSTTMANAVVDFFSSKAVDKNFKITPAQVRKALVDASKMTVTKTQKNSQGKLVTKKVGLGLSIPQSESLADVKSKISEKLSTENSTFADRKLFVEELIRLMSININKNDVSVEQFGKLFSEGIQNKYFKGITKTGKVKISATNMVQAMSEMFTEPMLKEGFDSRDSGGQVYAVIEVDGKVSEIDSDFHESYPKAIQAENPIKIHILKDRPYWYDVFDGGVDKDLRNKVYPTSGLSTRGLELTSGPKSEIEAQKEKVKALAKDLKDQVNKPNMGIAVDFRNQAQSDIKFYNTLVNLVSEYSKLKGMEFSQFIKEIETIFNSKMSTENIKYLSELWEDITSSQKKKASPSVKKVLGVKDTKITVSEAAALKSQIRLEARAAREAKADLNTKRRMVGDAIRKLVAKGKINTRVSTALLTALSRVNLDSKLATDRFLDYVGKVFADAEYAEKLSAAKATRKQLKSISKNKDKAANLRDLGSKFSKINPSIVEDIDQYNKIASAILESIKGSRLRGPVVKFADIVREVDLMGYISEMMDIQNQKMLDDKVAQANEILGIDGADLSYEELVKLLDKKEDLSEENERLIRGAINKAFDLYSTVIDAIIFSERDPFSINDPESDSERDVIKYTDAQKKIVREFMNMDLTLMSAKEALETVDALVNFLQNGSIAKMNSIVAKNKALTEMLKAERNGVKARPIRKYWSKKFGRVLIEYTANLNILLERMFVGFSKGGLMSNAMGLTDLKNGKSRAEKETNRIIEEYVSGFYTKKPNGEDFNTSYNNVERGMYAFMTRNVTGTEKERSAEFKRRKGLVTESIEALREGSKEEKEKAEVYQSVYDSMFSGDPKDADGLIIDKINKDAVQFWKDKWAEKYDQLYDVALGVYNKILDRDTDYIPDKYSILKSTKSTAELTSEEMAFLFNNGDTNIYKKEAGVLIPSERPGSLPRNDNKEATRFVDFSFDANNANSMYDALMDLNTAEAIRQVETSLNSKSFKRMVPEFEDRELLDRRVKLYVSNIRRKNPFSNDTFTDFVRSMDRLASIGVGQALGGFTQPIKQTIPIAVNTLINAGTIDTSIFRNPDKKAFLENSGYAIANRGVESLAQIDSLNKMIDEAANSKPEKAWRLVEDINNWWLKNLLVKFDVMIARASWMTYYEQGLKKQGIDPSSIDYSTHKVNEEAADYAQRQVDRQQNVSDNDLAGKLISTKDPIIRISMKIMMPFSSFRMNQSARLGSDMATLTSKESTVEDRKIAARSLAGFAAEMTTFRVLSAGIGYLTYLAAKAALGGEEDEEKNEKAKDSVINGQLTSTVGDLFSPLPLLDKGIQLGLSKALESTQDILEVQEDGRTKIYTGSQSSFLQDLGSLGVPLVRAEQLWEMVNLSAGGSFTDAFGRKKFLKEEDQETIKNLVPVAIMSGVGLVPAEINSIVRTTVREAKKNASTKKSGGGSNGGGNRIVL